MYRSAPHIVELFVLTYFSIICESMFQTLLNMTEAKEFSLKLMYDLKNGVVNFISGYHFG